MFGSKAEKMEKEKQDALEMGKEKKKEDEKKGEEKGWGALGISRPFLDFLNSF